jgi:hypothetical protein
LLLRWHWPDELLPWLLPANLPAEAGLGSVVTFHENFLVLSNRLFILSPPFCCECAILRNPPWISSDASFYRNLVIYTSQPLVSRVLARGPNKNSFSLNGKDNFSAKQCSWRHGGEEERLQFSVFSLK